MSPAEGDGPAVTQPGISFALNVVPAGLGGSHFRCEFLHLTLLPDWGRLMCLGQVHTRGVRSIHVQMLRLQQFIIHLESSKSIKSTPACVLSQD